MPTTAVLSFSEPRLFITGEKFFPVAERLIRDAREEILLSMYELRRDAVGSQFTRLLKDAARRGVRVRVLFDNAELLWNESEQVRKDLEDAGVSACVFRPLKTWLPWHPLSAACRNHARLFLIDRCVLGLGGMSFGDVSERRKDLFLLTRVARPESVVAFFEKLWLLAIRRGLPDPLAISPDALAAGGIGIRLLASGPEKRDQEIYRWCEEYFGIAKQRIVIATPFFFLDARLLRLLTEARKRGVFVEVITPLRTDKPRYDWFRAVPVPRLEKHGIVWRGTLEYFHTKFCITDDRWMLGSANFDIIGTERNYELNACGVDGAILKKLEEQAATLKIGASTLRSQPAPQWAKILFFFFHHLTEYIFKLK